MTNKAMDARVDRAMQSIASMGGQDATAILGWLRGMLAQKIILPEDVVTGRKSTVGETVRSWLTSRKSLPVQQQTVESFSSISEMRQALPTGNDSILKSERQHLLTDRRKARLESKRIQFDSGAVVEIPLTAFAASVYGRGSKWCTGAISANAFDAYARQSPLFILRTPDNEMFQITVPSDPSEFERILLDNGGMFMRDSLEQFIYMAMTVKNAQDGDLSEDEFNRFMPMANELFDMIGKSVFAEIKPTWDRYADIIRKEQGEDADEDELSISESDILDLMSSGIDLHNPAAAPAISDHLIQRQPPEAEEASAKIVNALVNGEYEEAKDAIFEYINVRQFSEMSKDTESALAAMIPDANVDGFLQWMLDNDLEAERSQTPMPFVFLGAVTTGLNILGAERVGAFVSKAMQSGDEVRDYMRDRFLRFPIDNGGAIYRVMIGANPKDAFEYATLWAGSNPTELDAKMLPEFITEQSWFKASETSSLKMGILCHGVMASGDQFDLDQIIDAGDRYHSIFSAIDMQAYPEAASMLLYEGNLTRRDFLMDAAKLEMLHDSAFREGLENELHEVLASALCRIIDRVPMMSGEDRMVAGLCLSSVSKDGIEILGRDDQWFAQAIYGRTTDHDGGATFRPIRTFDARDGEVTEQAMMFLAVNGVGERERKTMEIASFLSSVIPYPSEDDLAAIEAMAEAGDFPADSVRRLCDKGDAQIRSTCDRVRVAMAGMSGYSSAPQSAEEMLSVAEAYLKHMAVRNNPAGVERKLSRSPVERELSIRLGF